VGEIRRIDEMARRVRFFSAQVEKEGIPVRPLYESAPLVTVGSRAAQIRDELDVKLAEHEVRLSQMNESFTTLSTRTRELQEARHVLRETAVFFDRVSSDLKIDCGCVMFTVGPPYPQAESKETDTRNSIDDGTQPLLAGDAESQMHQRDSTGLVDLE